MVRAAQAAFLAGCLFACLQPAAADQRTAACQKRLQHWWNNVLGSFFDGATALGWWHTANGVEILANYGLATGDDAFAKEVANRRYHAEPDLLIRDDYSFDDQGWIALSWLQAWELQSDGRFLDLAVKWWGNILASAWTDQPCGGGLYWAGHGKSLHYKNAITNSLFMRLSARLYTVTSNSTYLDWAARTWNWFEGTGMIQATSGNVLDGLQDGSCTPTGSVYTYNQGALIGALAALYEAGGKKNATLLDVAHKVAAGMIGDGKDILADFGEGEGICSTDCWQFKGVFMRGLVALHKSRPLSATYSAWVRMQADSLWTKAQDTSTGSFGLMWAGPFDKADPIRQMSALDCFLAADAVGKGELQQQADDVLVV